MKKVIIAVVSVFLCCATAIAAEPAKITGTTGAKMLGRYGPIKYVGGSADYISPQLDARGNYVWGSMFFELDAKSFLTEKKVRIKYLTIDGKVIVSLHDEPMTSFPVPKIGLRRFSLEMWARDDSGKTAASMNMVDDRYMPDETIVADLVAQVWNTYPVSSEGITDPENTVLCVSENGWCFGYDADTSGYNVRLPYYGVEKSYSYDISRNGFVLRSGSLETSADASDNVTVPGAPMNIGWYGNYSPLDMTSENSIALTDQTFGALDYRADCEGKCELVPAAVYLITTYGVQSINLTAVADMDVTITVTEWAPSGTTGKMLSSGVNTVSVDNPGEARKFIVVITYGDDEGAPEGKHIDLQIDVIQNDGGKA